MSEDVIKQARDRLKADQEYWSENYRKAREDAKFLSDDDYAQWDENDYNNRVSSGRPALTIDHLTQFIHQVANDIRINTPTINIIPVGFDSSQEVAETLKGLIKSIEYRSNADNAYDTAVFNAIKQGIGFLRVDHDYVDDNSFDQELKICRVTNPLSVWLDSCSYEVDGRDAKHGTIVEQIKVSEFKRLYPGKEPNSFDSDEVLTSRQDDDFIAIAEHFVIEETEKTIGINEKGEVFELTGKQKAKRTRTVKERKVMRYKLSGSDILEETVFPGKYIPIVPVYGEENWIDGKRYLFSLIRKSKGAQKMLNYWKSLETELIMKSPIAPVMAAEGQVEDYAADWLNPSKAGVLRYKTQDAQGNAVGAPQRLEPPMIPSGVINASRGAVDDIKSTMGIYNASLGIRSNEQSGVAIAQRKQEGDVATFHFADNLSKAITQVGRILVSAVKDVYDTARILRIIGAEDEPKQVGVNGEMADDQEETIDLTKGSYDVRVVTGASYTTLRQESVEALQAIFNSQPELMQVMGDLYFKYSDFAGAQAMANRMKKVIDPKFLEKDDREEMQEEEAPDPEKLQMTQIIQEGQVALQTMQQEIETLKAQLQDKQMEVALKAQMEDKKIQADLSKTENEAVVKMQEIDLKQKEIDLKAIDIQTRINEMNAKNELEREKIQADLIKAVLAKGDDTNPQDIAFLISQALEKTSQMQNQTIQTMIQTMNRPKTVIRDEQGRVVGVQ